MGRRIVLLFHEGERGLDHSGYSVTRLYPTWRADGHEVVECFGCGAVEPGDLLFLHVDLSQVPEPYLALAAGYPAAVNGRVGDIRKSVFSPGLLRAGDPWEGPVIVKSERNFAGIPEAQLGLPRLDGRGLAPPFRSPMDYRLYAHLRYVPLPVFDCADLVVQRFLPELEDGLYHVRSYFFLGSWGRCTRIGSRNPIVKEESKETSRQVDVHPAILARRVELGLDYGKLDYVVLDGEAVLLDVNKTIGAGRFAHRFAGPGSAREDRARGLYSLFR